MVIYDDAGREGQVAPLPGQPLRGVWAATGAGAAGHEHQPQGAAAAAGA